MELTQLQDKMFQPFIEKTIESLEEMTTYQARAGDPFEDQVEKFRFKGFAVACEISGKIEGWLLMHHYIETSVAIGKKLLEVAFDAADEALEKIDCHADTIPEELQEALDEWGNVAIGHSMKALANNKLDIRFHSPYFIRTDTDMSNMLSGINEIISVPIHVDGVGRFYLNLLCKQKTH